MNQAKKMKSYLYKVTKMLAVFKEALNKHKEENRAVKNELF